MEKFLGYSVDIAEMIDWYLKVEKFLESIFQGTGRYTTKVEKFLAMLISRWFSVVVAR